MYGVELMICIKKVLVLLLGWTLLYPAGVFANSIIVCQNERCHPTNARQDVTPYLQKIQELLQGNPNGRLDFCEADPSTHQCVNNAIYWNMQTDTQPVRLAIPNARIHITDKTAYLDYLISANHSFPRCMFSPLQMSVTPHNSVRIVSGAYNCQLMETEPTNLQKIFTVDFMDLDHHVVGGAYAIQGGGALEGQASGYALMQFRESKQSLPLVARRHRNKAPQLPTMGGNVGGGFDNGEFGGGLDGNPYADTGMDDPYDPFLEQQDWWDSVKETWQAIKETSDITPIEDRPVGPDGKPIPDQISEDHWWKTFSRTFMKVIYLEPLK